MPCVADVPGRPALFGGGDREGYLGKSRSWGNGGKEINFLKY